MAHVGRKALAAGAYTIHLMMLLGVFCLFIVFSARVGDVAVRFFVIVISLFGLVTCWATSAFRLIKNKTHLLLRPPKPSKTVSCFSCVRLSFSLQTVDQLEKHDENT